MTQAVTRKLTLEEFFALPEGEPYHELIDGEAIPQVSPKRFHCGVQKAFLLLLDPWTENRGFFYQEWAVTLTRNGNDWVPIPDLLYISYDRLAADWPEDGPCPVAPELVIEIISPDQTFGEMAEKATNYLNAGVLRVWVVDPKAQSITVFMPDAAPITYRGGSPLTDPLFPGLELTAQQVFQKAGLDRR
jgi:Uma2 family endonuclease